MAHRHSHAREALGDIGGCGLLEPVTTRLATMVATNAHISSAGNRQAALRHVEAMLAAALDGGAPE